MTSSRNPTPRPRRVAGRTSAARPDGEVEPVETTAAEAPAEPQVVEPVETTAAEAPAEPQVVGPQSVDEDPAPATEVSTSSTNDGSPEPEAATAPPADRTTLALVLAVMALVAVVLLQVAYLWGPLEDDPTVSGERPVLLSRAAERSATDTAAKAAVAFTQRSYETYDEQVDEAAAMMTTDFEKQFRQTTDDARGPFIEAETQVTAEVAAQGVMTASEQQVEALVFLNQFTIRKGEESVFTPYRLKVTLIDTEQGWLVSDVEAA
jgi:Mce-associated membrane protein